MHKFNTYVYDEYHSTHDMASSEGRLGFQIGGVNTDVWKAFEQVMVNQAKLNAALGLLIDMYAHVAGVDAKQFRNEVNQTIDKQLTIIREDNELSTKDENRREH